MKPVCCLASLLLVIILSPAILMLDQPYPAAAVQTLAASDPETAAIQPDQSLQEAIDAAAPGEVIRLAPGTWNESVTIDKSLTLQGAGAELTIIHGQEKGRPVVSIVGEGQITVKLAGLTTTGAQGECADPDMEIRPHGILIQGEARVTIIDVSISGNEWSGIMMSDSANIEITGSTISENRNSAGIELRDETHAVITDSVFFGNWHAVLLWDQAQGVINDCSFSDNYWGVGVGIEAQAVITGSTFYENARGIGIGGQAHAAITAVTITGSRLDGILVWGSATVEMADSVISENRLGLGLSSSAYVTGHRLTFSGNGDGIRLSGAASALITDSTIVISQDDGIEMRDRSQIEVSGTDISNNRGGGLSLAGNALATVTDSTLSDNEYGAKLRGAARLETTDSAFVASTMYGIRVTNTAQLVITDSSLSENSIGISLKERTWAAITRVTIADNRMNGIELLDGATGEIYGNLINDNGQVGILSFTEALPQGSGNIMRANGVDLLGNIEASLRVPLVEPAKAEVLFPHPAYPTIQHAVDALLPGGRLILSNGDYAGGITIGNDLMIMAAADAEPRIVGGYVVVSLVGAAQVELAGITLTDGQTGLIASQTAQAMISGAAIVDNHGDGLVLLGSASGLITDLTIAGNGRNGIMLSDSTWIEIAGSDISDNRGCGLLLSDLATAVITDSNVSGNRGNGVMITGAVEAEIVASTISGNSEHGIELWDSTRTILRGNTITGNGYFGITATELIYGHVSGHGNIIPGSEDPDGNAWDAVRPIWLSVLITQQGGQYP